MDSARKRELVDSMQLAELDALPKKNRWRQPSLPFRSAAVQSGNDRRAHLCNQSVDGKSMTIMEAAEELNITLIASASLLQGQVASNLPEFVGEALGLDSDAERALQFVRSSPESQPHWWNVA